MVTLAVFCNDSTMETVDERPRKRQRLRKVRFSTEKPATRTFENYQGATSEEQRTEIRKHIWYTREEFDEFLSDRLHTIRMWRAVGGNTRLIEPFYCTRGLEMYQSAELNGDVLTARAEHIRSVLTEQMRQKRLTPHHNHDGTTTDDDEERIADLDWDKLAQAVAHRSAWAMRQATRLALRDAWEAHENLKVPSGNANPPSDDFFSQMPATMKRHSMTLAPNAGAPRSISSRLALPTSALYGTGAAAPARIPVDVHKLKEMNRQFLESMSGPRATGASLAQQQSQQQQQSYQPKRSLARPDSLALLLVRGRKHELQANAGKARASHQEPSLRHAIRRDSLHGLFRETKN